MGKEKKEKKKDREAGAASEADVTMDTTATEVREYFSFAHFINLIIFKHAVIIWIDAHNLNIVIC
jgi:hypothetical protein